MNIFLLLSKKVLPRQTLHQEGISPHPPATTSLGERCLGLETLHHTGARGIEGKGKLRPHYLLRPLQLLMSMIPRSRT